MREAPDMAPVEARLLLGNQCGNEDNDLTVIVLPKVTLQYPSLVNCASRDVYAA